MKVTINANNAIASVDANPKIATLNNSCLNEGLREIPKINGRGRRFDRRPQNRT